MSAVLNGAGSIVLYDRGGIDDRASGCLDRACALGSDASLSTVSVVGRGIGRRIMFIMRLSLRRVLVFVIGVFDGPATLVVGIFSNLATLGVGVFGLLGVSGRCLD